jgi:hypothetical protein
MENTTGIISGATIPESYIDGFVRGKGSVSSGILNNPRIFLFKHHVRVSIIGQRPA